MNQERKSHSSSCGMVGHEHPSPSTKFVDRLADRNVSVSAFKVGQGIDGGAPGLLAPAGPASTSTMARVRSSSGPSALSTRSRLDRAVPFRATAEARAETAERLARESSARGAYGVVDKGPRQPLALVHEVVEYCGTQTTGHHQRTAQDSQNKSGAQKRREGSSGGGKGLRKHKSGAQKRRVGVGGWGKGQSPSGAKKRREGSGGGRKTKPRA